MFNHRDRSYDHGTLNPNAGPLVRLQNGCRLLPRPVGQIAVQLEKTDGGWNPLFPGWLWGYKAGVQETTDKNRTIISGKLRVAAWNGPCVSKLTLPKGGVQFIGESEKNRKAPPKSKRK